MIDALGAGGAELLLAELASAAPAAGIELTAAGLKEGPNLEAAARLRERGVEPYFVPITSLLSPSDLMRVRRHLAEVRPDVLHTHLGNADLLGGVAARLLGIPTVSTVHADWWGGDRRLRTKLWLMARARRHCAAQVLAVSESSRRAYLAQGWDRPEHVRVVHNGIGAQARPGSGAAVRQELGLAADAPVVTMMSTVRPEKGFDVAIQAALLLRERFPGLRLVIAGRGHGLAEVRRLAERAGDTVVITGHRDDVMEVLDATDVLLQPSRFDAFPTSLMEAMAASVPIVATAVGGIPEMVDHERSGLLVPPPPRAEPFAAALGDLLADPDRRRRLAQEGRKRFDGEFRADRWAARLREVYDSAASQGRRRSGRYGRGA